MEDVTRVLLSGLQFTDIYRTRQEIKFVRVSQGVCIGRVVTETYDAALVDLPSRKLTNDIARLPVVQEDLCIGAHTREVVA